MASLPDRASLSLQTLALAVVLAVGQPAWAQKVCIGPATGPGAAAVQRQLAEALCDTADCVDAPQVTTAGQPDWKKAKANGVSAFLTAVGTKKGKAISVTVELITGSGAPRFEKRLPLTRGMLTQRELAQVIDGVSAWVKPAAAEKASPPTSDRPTADPKKTRPQAVEDRAAPEEKAEPRRAPRPEPVEPDTAEPSEAAKEPWLAIDLAVALFNRVYDYSDATSRNLRRYELPFYPAPRLGVTVSPLAGQGTSALAGLGVEASADLQPWLKSRKRSDPAEYPTSATRFDGALRWKVALPVGVDVSLVPALGVRQQSFSVAAASDGSKLDGLPDLAFLGLRASLGVEASFLDRQLVTSLRGSALPVFSAGEVISAAWFPRGAVFGFEVSGGLGYRVTPAIQARLGVEFVRYALTFTTQPTDMFLASGATDQYLGANLGLRLEL